MAAKKKGSTKPESLSGFTRFRKEWIEPILIAFVLAAIIRSFIMAPFKIPSGSMEDTLLVGDQLMAVKFIYGIRIPFAGKFLVHFRDPRPGEVIVFKFPVDPSKDFIKRCIAVGGQTVEIRNKEVYVDGVKRELPEHSKFIDPHFLPAHLGPRDNMPPTKVPEGHMFMMGDNRDNSNDSRFWGFVPYDNIIGRAVIIWWSWNHEAPLYDIVHRIRWTRYFKIIR
ncbi:MAG: signal peptidase I [Candidatus Latescibacteria bacterium]|nr:signal peptidase I [Candidatus Latescibacterota bacterium]